MTGGALIQLIAYGAQDVYLTGNPQITFFKMVYRRYTNFSMEWVQQKATNSNGKFGQRLEIIIERVGDLLGETHVEVSVPALMQVQAGFDINGNPANSTFVGFCDSFMNAVCRVMELYIGGQLIDRQYGDWLEIWAELTIPESKQRGYNEMIGKYVGTSVALQNNALPYNCKKNYRFRLPLQFWFCRNPGCYLPLIALQYHEVRITLDLRAPAELIRSDVNITDPIDWSGQPWNANDIQIWSNYIYLDTDERRKFATLGHEMLIEQLQFNSQIGIPDGATYQNIELEFNHPLKECMWVVPSDPICGNSLTGNDYFNYSGNITGSSLPPNIDTFDKAKFVLNGQDRFEAKSADYFRLAQPYQYHTRIPQRLIYVYSFALKPEEIQPSGTCNASRIDSFVFNVSLGSDCCSSTNRVVRLYATNYNILRIMSGMGGLAFSN
jgi:hypothetical protein